MQLASPAAALALAISLVGGCWGRSDRKVYRLPSSGMEPTIHCARPAPGCLARAEDRIVVNTRPGKLRRGDIVVFETPRKAVELCGSGGLYVKRVVGLPGESVSERAGGAVYVDGRKLQEPYVTPERRGDGVVGRWRVPRGRYFLLGDNRASSCDSRIWGSVRRESIVGRVVRIERAG